MPAGFQAAVGWIRCRGTNEKRRRTRHSAAASGPGIRSGNRNVARFSPAPERLASGIPTVQFWPSIVNIGEFIFRRGLAFLPARGAAADIIHTSPGHPSVFISPAKSCFLRPLAPAARLLLFSSMPSFLATTPNFSSIFQERQWRIGEPREGANVT